MRNERNDRRGRVIVGVGSAKESVTALQYALREAHRRDALLMAVAVWKPFGGDVADRAYPCPELNASHQALARNRLDTVCERAGLPGGATVVRRVERGPLGPVLAHLADRPDDLLVVGRRQAFTRLRSPAGRYCQRHASAPVLVVPPDWTPNRAEPALAA